ncbi:MAG: tetratricopeptide repeat protein [Sulfuricurvum sp.]|uniref:tetratricopeptide repeat protein n=1 Tax=Sulfuricurvum sp. TaxID=2025608 RepID=UPI002622F0ED|nr:tetratricopeptide repeat protein [Sulfuricurvum sp.]MDD2828859.1 tetratricopeptide repeat protein [Sulfuricurvum sp.]MDD4948522.1 tetratricopeptide repeat protein [Sulfuricurvum sp.]
MADQEEIIIIEEADAAGVEAQSSTEGDSAATKTPLNKKKIAIIAGALLLLLGGGGLTFAFLSHSGNGEAIVQEEPLIASNKEQEPAIEPSQLENMIERANYMYANGNQGEALKLFEKIALYSESISQYNLGVVRLKEKEYQAALENFKRSISMSENRCVSAINAAVCCLHLEQKENFNYYIDLAQAYLSSETNSPLYSYYYSLINYYRGNYFEALSALNHPSTSEYQLTQNKLKASIDTLYGNYTGAIGSLEKPLQETDSFSLGLLYANNGNLIRAREYLNNAVFQSKKPIQEYLSLAFVDLKLGQHQEAGGILKKVTDSYPDDVYTPYPIKVTLRPTLFSPDSLQKAYRTLNAKVHPQTYPKIFAFAPYKIFNASQTISYIRKGNANIYIDDVASAKEYLEKSSNASDVDYGIALAIQKALSYHLRDANAQFLKLVKEHPSHSILNYDLALTYAQLGDYTKANDYFLRSYHADANNYLSGIFAVMSSEMIMKKNPKLISIIKDNLLQEGTTEEFDLYRTLFAMSENNYPSASRWLDNHYKERPLYQVMKIIIATELGIDDSARKASEKLTYMQPHDLLPHLLYIDTHYKDEAPKAYARSALNYLKNQKLTYDDLYFGPQIVRERGITIAAITGMLAPMIQRLETKYQNTTENRANIASALALAYFYNQDFEKSYTLYNEVVDTYGVQDERTLFMAASASIGAEHVQNAIALLELSKMTNPNYLENRYALGLLYMQVQNNPAAIIQFNKMGNSGFKSNMFDFSIDTDKLASEPNTYHPL